MKLSEVGETVSQFSFLKSRLRLIEGKYGMAVYNYFKVIISVNLAHYVTENSAY